MISASWKIAFPKSILVMFIKSQRPETCQVWKQPWQLAVCYWLVGSSSVPDTLYGNSRDILLNDHTDPLPMQSLPIIRAKAFRSASLRSFTSSVSRAQAVPLEKPVLNKEFKIYRWVCIDIPSLQNKSLGWPVHPMQNPDEPAKKPTLQSYTIDLNQTGPMVSCSSRRITPWINLGLCA